MSRTYFCFSDECGDYMTGMSKDQLQVHPFYLRTTLIINSSEWKKLNNSFRDLKTKYSLPLTRELKWSYLWAIKKFQDNNRKIKDKSELKFLENHSYETLIQFVEESLLLLNNLKEKKVIATYTKNTLKNTINQKDILSLHLKEHIRRLEMELQSNANNLGVLFIDPVDNNKNALFRNIYNELFEQGDYISNYKSIKDSLNIENSHHSVGIQIADFVSGTFNSILKISPRKDYKKGVELFYNYIYPNLRRSGSGVIQGYGIKEVPTNSINRLWIKEKIKELKPF